MNKNPVPHNEKERVKALRSYKLLDSENEEAFDNIVQIASAVCKVPISLITLIDENRQWIKAKIGMDIVETAREDSFCQYTILHNELLEIQDATKDDRLNKMEAVTGDDHIRFYAGYPLVDPKGYAIGSLCVIDKEPHQLNDEQRRILKLLAGQVVALVLMRKENETFRNYQQLFELSNAIIVVLGFDGYFKEINPAFCRLLGWSKEELLAKHIVDFVHPDDRDSVIEKMQQLGDSQPTSNIERRYLKKSGEYAYIKWDTTPDIAGELIYGIGRDVTAEKHAQELVRITNDKLRAFFEHSQGLMCTHDLQGNFISVNQAGASLLGYTVEEVLGKSLFDIVPATQHTGLRAYLHEMLTVGKSQGQMTTVHKNGSRLVWLYNNIVEQGINDEPYVIANAIDISERHKLEKDLERTREMLELTNHMARIGGWMIDMAKDVVYWTTVTSEIHEVPPMFVPTLSNAINFFKKGESYQQITRAINQARNHGKSWDLELQLITAKGREIWVRTQGHADMENGTARRMYGTFQDIDHRKKTELEAERSRKLLREVLAAASEVSIIATDLEGRITVFNSGAERLLGYQAAELLGKQFIPELHDAQEVEEKKLALLKEYNITLNEFEAMTYIPNQKGSEQGEWTFITKHRERKTVSLVITPIRDVDNNQIGYLGIATDISERKKAEQDFLRERARLLSFVEHAPAAVAMFDKKLCYIAASKRWMEEYHLSGNIIGESHYDVFPNISDEWKDIHQQVLKGVVMKRDEEVWRPAGWKHNQYLRWEVRPWFLLDNTIGGIMMFTQDITESVIQREELKHAKQIAEQVSVAKSEFLANMSHEIRTPLNGVIGFTDLVLKTKLTETQQQYLTIVNQSGNVLLSIINDILDLSKIEAGKFELDEERCDLFEMGSQAADIIAYQAQKKGVEILLNIATDLPRFIYIDALRLKQVLVNLLGNASKFTERGEIELKIEALSDLVEGEIALRFEVRDTGIGIKPEKQAKIFEAFSQEDASTTKKYGGTGIGLTISNKILALMGSKLQLLSTPGVGSTFYFDVTCKAETGDAEAWTPIEEIKHVLIVDDNLHNREILKQMLLLKGIQSTTVSNGLEAIQQLASGTEFDLLMVDYHMPYMDGLETIRKVRENFFDHGLEKPIILLHSSSDDETIISGCETLHVRHRLVKPIKMWELYQTLQRLYKPIEEGLQQNAMQDVLGGDLRAQIMVVEDNAVNMLLTKTILKKFAPNVDLIEVTNGIDAVKLTFQQRPDLILMDVQIPEMNGYEATQKIREWEQHNNYPHIPIIALTAGNIKGEREKCLAAGMDDFLSKPVVEESIIAVLKKWLNASIIQEIKPMPIENPSEHFNMDVLTMYLGEDNISPEILELSVNEITKSLQTLEESIETKNLEGVKRMGHKLFGTTSMVGMKTMAGLAREFDTLEAFDTAHVMRLWADTQAASSIALSMVEEQIKKLSI
ncbi:PAS domain S-box protein [Chitinophaga skermanii]|nr:PAS domain S-box protein [Chitinophaga skermanii]